MKIKFEKSKGSKSDKLYFKLSFEGGDADADTRHPHFEDTGIKYSEWKNNMKSLEEQADMFETVKEILTDSPSGSDMYDKLLVKFGDSSADYLDCLIPRDPANDFQNCCYLESIQLVGYDKKGTEYTSYINSKRVRNCPFKILNLC